MFSVPLQEKRADAWLFGLCILANLVGLCLLYSATRYDVRLHPLVYKQALASVLGVGVFFWLNHWDVECLTERFWSWLLGGAVCLLLLLIPFGMEDGTGNKSWLNLPLGFHLQSGELVKVVFVLLLALCLSRYSVQKAKVILGLTAGVLGLCALVFVVSGDMGMILVYLLLYAHLLFAVGLAWRWCFLGAVLAVGAGAVLWQKLPSYIQLRFLVVFDHGLDPQGKGFQQLRSLLAIGSGETSGQGFLQGLQTQNPASSALPARHTDFIFSVAGEEMGIWGCLGICLLLLGLVFRCAFLAYRAPTPFLSLVCLGVGGVLAIQSLLNLGMCLFVAPVVGLTLPFFSYGGSSLLTLYAMLGLVSSSHSKE